VADAQKMSKATGGRDVRRAGLQPVRDDVYFPYILQGVTVQTLWSTQDLVSTARSGVGRDTGSSPAA
jgi:hypothetical protein